VGFNSPLILSILNSSVGKVSIPESFHLHGMNPSFFKIIYFLDFYFSKSLSNLTGSPSIIFTIGFAPKAYIGIITGIGLSLIIIIKSSLNFLSSSGIAHTLISLGTSFLGISILSYSIQ